MKGAPHAIHEGDQGTQWVVLPLNVNTTVARSSDTDKTLRSGSSTSRSPCGAHFSSLGTRCWVDLDIVVERREDSPPVSAGL